MKRFLFITCLIFTTALRAETQWKPYSSDEPLKPLLVKAQFHFLKGSLAKAREIFTEIDELKLHQSWSLKNREYIVYAQLRLAQMARSKNKRSFWLRQAWEFDGNIEPDENLFPPPIVKEWMDLAQSSPKKTYLLPQGIEKFSHSYIFKLKQQEK